MHGDLRGVAAALLLLLPQQVLGEGLKVMIVKEGRQGKRNERDRTWSPSESFVCPVRTWVSGAVSSCCSGRQPPRGSSLSIMSASVAFGLAPIRLVSPAQV